MSQYKCVPAPKNILVGRSGKADDAANVFADIMNEQARDGWNFFSMEELHVTEPTGCFSQNTLTITHYMLIFRKD